MKFKFCFLLMVPALLTGITPMVAEPAPGIVATNNPGTLPNTAISFDQIGAMAGKQCSGDGLAVAACSEGASLRCVFQRLNAKATTQGLWLMSTKDRANGETFRVVARAVGRTKTEPLAASGKVKVKGQVARFFRPGLTEEYSVSIDGLQQDFVIKQRPAGNGPMRLELEVDGARVGRTAYGAQLVLANSGRRIAYSRLRALDAKGKALPARMEVVYKSEIGNRKSEMNLAVVLDDVGAEYPVRIDPTFSDANWISLGGIAGTDGYVSAAAVDASGNLFIGGWFAVAGNVSANNIARWDGSSWSTLASGMNGEVDALAMSGTNLFAGGYFTTAGGVSANNIAQWNGNRWAALGSGMNGPVGALAVSGTNLYAASGFSIAQWNGSSWSALGAGMAGGDANGPSVYALTISGNTLYAGGDFGTAGGVSANCIAQWDGTNWSALGSGISGLTIDDSGTYVDALAVSGTNLYVGGAFSTAGDVSAPCIAEWNGSSWSTLGSGMGGDTDDSGPAVYCLAVLGTNLYAGGSFVGAGGVSADEIAQWNGTSWSALGAGMGGGEEYSDVGAVRALAVSDNTLYAGGDLGMAGDVTASSIAEWDGTNWSALGRGINGLVTALAVSSKTLYAGIGFFEANGLVVDNGIVQWDGSGWSQLGSGVNGAVAALAVKGNTLYAGGWFGMAGGVSASGIAQWNGSSWSPVGSGMDGPALALVVSGTNLYAGGWFDTAGGVSAINIAQWNGNSWLALGSGIGGGGPYFSPYITPPLVTALAVSGNILYAGGQFTTAGDVSATNIAQWDGSSWSALGSGMAGDTGGYDPGVYSLAVSGNTLYAGGSFTMAGGVPANCIAQWDGSSWSALGSGVAGDWGGFGPGVYSLAVKGNTLYAGGAFTMAGGVSANYIAQWDGNSWSALGSGIGGPNPYVYALAVSGNALYVGGDFMLAGEQPAPYAAELVLLPTAALHGKPLHNTNGSRTMDLSSGTGSQSQPDSPTNLLPPVIWQHVYTNYDGALSQFMDTNTIGLKAKFYRVSPP